MGYYCPSRAIVARKRVKRNNKRGWSLKMNVATDISDLLISKAAQRLLEGMIDAELQGLGPRSGGVRRRRIISHVSECANEVLSDPNYHYDRATNSKLGDEIRSAHRKFSLDSREKIRDDEFLNEFAFAVKSIARRPSSKK